MKDVNTPVKGQYKVDNKPVTWSEMRYLIKIFKGDISKLEERVKELENESNLESKT